MDSCDLDGRAMATRKEFHTHLAKVCGFPDHYGANMDALVDALEDLLTARGSPLLLLRVRNWETFAEAAPDQALALLQALADVNARQSGMRVALAPA